MKLSHAGSYAIQALAYLAEQGHDRPVGAHVIAQDRGIPERFLLKVLRQLVLIRVLDSLKGPNGGYGLARPANRISLLEVLEAMEGPIRNQYEQSGRKEGAAIDRRIHAVYDEVNDSIRRQLAKVSIGDLVSGKRKGK
jgi:Rrf2 family protein